MNKPLKLILIVFSIVAIIVFIIVVKFNKEDKENNNNLNIMMDEKIIRSPAVAGSFYPADKKELFDQIDIFFKKIKFQNYQNPRAIIVPHAGIIYSGQTAAYAFKELEGQNIKKVIVIGPSHHEYLDKLGLSHADAWQTPLGEVKIDTGQVKELEKNSEFIYADSAIDQEHSLEIQLPFLQIVLKNDWELIPIIAGQISTEEINSAAQAIINLLDEDTILVISTDLSHYYSKEEAQKIDQKCLESIQNLEFNSECEACGEIPLKLLFAIGQQMDWQAQILKHSDSGDVTGDEKVVGYVSAILTGKINNSSEKNEYSEGDLFAEVLTKAERKYLLKLARDTIDYAFENNGELMPIKNVADKFKEKRGVFVTLHKDGKLRGCIGYIEPIEKLYLAVQSNALSAAFNDPRFNSLGKKELKYCEIEISILTVPEKTELKKIQEGIDGVILKQDNNQATYLPQVWEDVAGPGEFYGSLCIKAGLQADCYTDPETKFYKYRAEVFKE